MLFECLVLFFFQPIVEYYIHKKLHEYKVNIHIDHHKVKFNEYNPSIIPFILSFNGMLYLPQYYLIWLIIIKYQMLHILSHYFSYCGRSHHKRHHKHWNTNYSFSIDGIWIDYLMNTKYKKKEK